MTGQEFETIKSSISDGADGDVGNAGGWGSISASMVRTKKVGKLQGEIKKVEKRNEYYNSLIQNLEQDNKTILENNQ